MKLIIGAKQLQKFLQLEGFYNGKIDGLIGKQSIAAGIEMLQSEGIQMTASWEPERVFLAVAQIMFVELGLNPGTVDGLWGPNTQYALEQYQNLLRDLEASPEERAQQSTVWPIYSQMERFYGPVGQNITLVTLPYKMKLAWDTDQTVTKMSLNRKCAESAEKVFAAALDHYGLSEIQRLRLDLFGGSLNVRKMRGGSNWSVHSWAAAIDIDPEHNQFRWSNTKATLDELDYEPWWKLWEAEGWVSLGRERNFDWMHVQACRL